MRDRQQRVVIDGSFSDTISINSSVPQRCILDPLLFVLSIIGIYEQISPGTSIALYADDTKIWRRILSYADCETLNRDLKALNIWAIADKMKFHSQKCKVLTVSLKYPNYYILPFDRFLKLYELGNDIIDYVTKHTDLGVTVTNRMSWEEQQDKIIMKASRQLGLIRRTCHFIKNIAQKHSLYIALVRSLLEHWGEIWGPNVVTAVNKFEPIQKKAVK